MLFAAIFHPPPDSTCMQKLPAQYRLTRAQLLKSLPTFIGLPVTFEHKGIHAAISKLPEFNRPSAFEVSVALETSTDASHRTLGHVLEAFEAHDGGFWALLKIDFTNKSGLYQLIASGMLQSVSLTHMVKQNSTEIVPLEIALVGNPARPGCRIRFASKSALNMQLYKASVIAGTTNTMSLVAASQSNTMEVDGKAPTCEDVLNGMTPTNRQIIASKLAYLVACMDKQKAQLVAANESLAAKSYDQETDNALLKSQLAQLWSAMDETAKQNLAVPSVEALSKSLSSNNANEMRQTMLKTIMCCNQSMMLRDLQSKTVHAESAPKRVKVDNSIDTLVTASKETVPTDKTEPAPEHMSPEEALKRALTETFEM